MSLIAWIVPLCPLLAFLLIVFGGRRSGGLSAALGIIGVGAGFVASVAILIETLGGGRVSQTFPWLAFPVVPGGGAPIPAAQMQGAAAIAPGSTALLGFLPLGFQVDSLTSLMLVVVTSVSFLVQIYSLGYMKGEPGFARYYAAISLFTASMLGLVLGNNLLAIYICWELVGLCSYLLIGHWHERPEAAAAAKKAFLVTRVGDVGFLLGILFLYWHSGTFAISDLGIMAADGRLPTAAVTVGILLVFCGAVGKSAQFPLHVWLPDAMEGPTPVSALIHAATMVAAGVYLMARTYPILEHSPTAMAVVATVGGFTAIFAASMGLVAPDIKRVLAYSTVSQLGYMMLAIGVGAMGAGMFHLFNHAFFKALLFLCAGSVIHAVGTNDMFQMGGLRKRLPITTMTMTIGALSLAGLPPFSGFWSKDEILGAALAANPLLFTLALITVGMTAFYMFRVIFLTFGGENRAAPPPRAARAARARGRNARNDSHAHEDTHAHASHGEPLTMAIPLLILVVPSVISGLWGAPFLGNGFAEFINADLPHAAHEAAFNPLVASISVIVALAGIGLAWAMYGGGKTEPAARLTAQMRPIYQLLMHRYYIDDLYNGFVTHGVLGAARAATWFDTNVVDATVNGTGALAIAVGSSVRRIQTGQVQTYAWGLFAGFLTIAAFVAALRFGH